MKRSIVHGFLFIFLLGSPIMVSANSPIQIVLNNDSISFAPEPIIENEVLFIPLRPLIEELGAEVFWDADTETIIIQQGTTIIEQRLHENTAQIDQKTVQITSAPILKEGTTFVPADYIADVLGGEVKFYSELHVLHISYPIEVTPSKDEDTISKNKSPYIPITESLNINPATEDLQALVSYLEKNVEGFDRENCRLELVNLAGSDWYDILYRLYYNGYATPYRILLSVEGKDISYVSNLNEFSGYDSTSLLYAYADAIPNEVVEKAKKEMQKDIVECRVDYQEVIKSLDKDGKPFLDIKTVYIHEYGSRFAFRDLYYLN